MPAFYLLLITLSLKSLILNKDGSIFFPAAAASATYVMNWARAFNWVDDYNLGHTWSLSLEEQFYLIWPVFLILIPVRRQLLVTISLIFGVIIWRNVLLFNNASEMRLYNGFDTHADSILIGCALALLPYCTTSLNPAVSLISVVILSAQAMFEAQEIDASLSIGSTVAGLATALLILNVVKPGWVTNFLSWQPFRFTGKISYGWYLWHYPAMMYGAYKFPGFGKALFAFGSYGAAVLSYFLVERPILRLKSRFNAQIRSSRKQESGSVLDPFGNLRKRLRDVR